MRKFIATAAATAALAGGALVAATPANAAPGSPNCMTKAEWFKVHKGMSRDRVHQITGIWGHKTNDTYYSDGEHDIDVNYKQCNRHGRPARGSWNNVWMSFANGHYNNDYDWVRGYMRLDYKGAWSTPWVI